MCSFGCATPGPPVDCRRASKAPCRRGGPKSLERAQASTGFTRLRKHEDIMEYAGDWGVQWYLLWWSQGLAKSRGTEGGWFRGWGSWKIFMQNESKAVKNNLQIGAMKAAMWSSHRLYRLLRYTTAGLKRTQVTRMLTQGQFRPPSCTPGALLIPSGWCPRSHSRSSLQKVLSQAGSTAEITGLLPMANDLGS